MNATLGSVWLPEVIVLTVNSAVPNGVPVRSNLRAKTSKSAPPLGRMLHTTTKSPFAFMATAGIGVDVKSELTANGAPTGVICAVALHSSPMAASATKAKSARETRACNSIASPRRLLSNAGRDS
jgi:hypothetical protein